MPTAIDKHLDTINTAFTSLIPALAKASPNTHKSGEMCLRQITARIPNLAAQHAPSASAAPTSTARSTDNRVNSLSPSEKRSILVIKRAQKAISLVAKDPISPEELFTMLSCPFEGTHQDGEDAAFMRIFKGYELQSLDEWDWADQDSMTSIDDRLINRFQSMLESDPNHSGTTFIATLLYQIETIKFAVGWEKQGPGIGGKNWKSKWYTTAFELTHANAFDNLTPLEKEEKMSDMAVQYAKWVHDNKDAVTARNRLVTMYTKFSPCILLDPIWDARLKCLKTFALVLDYLTKHIPPIDEEHRDDYDENATCLTPLQEHIEDTIK